MPDIQQLLSEYRSVTKALASRWGDINAIISGGFAPSKECGESFQKALLHVQEIYAAIRTAAAEVCPEAAGEDLPVERYAEMIEQYFQEEARRAEDRKVLERFVSVEAKADKYRDALKPFQQEAADLLAQGGEVTKEALEAPSVFLSCLELEDPDSPDGEALMESFSRFYPNTTLYHGVIFKKYILAEGGGQPAPSPKAEPAAAPQAAEPAKDAGDEKPASDKTEEAPPAEAETAEPQKPSSRLVPATTQITYSSPSASVFKKEIKNTPMAGSILPLFTHLNALYEQQIIAFVIFMSEKALNKNQLEPAVHAALEKLVAKNLLAAYDVKGNGLLTYCLTPYCLECMMKNSIITNNSLWSMNYGKARFSAAQNVEADVLEQFTTCNFGLMLYLCWARNTQKLRAFYRLRSSISWRRSWYTVSLRWRDEDLPNVPLLMDLAGQPLPEGNVLLCWLPDDEEKANEDAGTPTPPNAPPAALPENGSVFCIRANCLYRWNGTCWVTEQEDAPPSPDGGPEDDGGKPEDPPDAPQAESDAAEDADAPADLQDAPPAASAELPAEPIAGEDGTQEEPLAPPAPPAETPLVYAVPPMECVLPAGGISALIDGPEDLSEYGIHDGLDARALAGKLLEHGLSPDHVQIYQSLTDKLILENRITAKDDIVENSVLQAVVLSKALALFHPAYQPDFQRLVLALDSRIEEHRYVGEQILTLFEADPSTPPVLKLAALLRALFAPDTAYDYNLRSYARSVFDHYEENFPNLSLLKTLFSLLLELAEESPAGFSTQVLRAFSDKAAEQDLLRQITCDARKSIPEPRVNSGLMAMTHMVARCFGPGSDLRGCMEIIAEDRRNERELVQTVLSSYLGEDGGLSDSLIDRFYEENWQWAIEKKRAPKDIFPYQRAKVIDLIRARLNLMSQWLELTEKNSEGDSKWFRGQRKQILLELERVLPLLEECTPYDQAILRMSLTRLQQKLNGRLREDLDDFADFLRTGVFCLDEKGVPCLDAGFPVCRYYEPWRNALLHIASQTEGLRSVLERIADPTDPLVYDNLGQAVDICQYLNRHCGGGLSVEQYSEDLEATRKSAWEAIEKFMGELESAFAYGRLSEFVKEDLLSAVYTVEQKPSVLLELFDERHNYGCLRALLDALRKSINEKTAERQRELQADIEDRMKSASTPRMEAVLQTAMEKLKEPERNFVVAEEYINRFDAGVSEDMDAAMASNTFLDFIGEEYNRIYSLCREHSSASLRGFGGDYVERELRRRSVSSQYQNSAQQLLKNMPNRPEDAAPIPIMAMMKELGFDVKTAEVVRTASAGSTMVRLSVAIQPDAKDKAEYAHPVDIMGTRLRSPVDVVCLFGRMQPNDIVDKVCGLELRRTAIVFLNGPLDLAGRRQIAERFHRDTSGQNPFLLIDWVLLLYLALRQKTDRLPTLLSCTLPYTSSFQPFVEEGSVSDEMFSGRKRELNKILDPNGPVIVYGGRQLGKSALLERAQSLANHPSKREFAVLIRAGSMVNEEALTCEIVQELPESLNIPPVRTMQELCQALRKAYAAGRWVRLLVLIDESDKLLENFRGLSPAYRPIIALSDLTRATGNDFKFVFAGLHDVCAAATDRNTVFGQFGAPLIIKPLRPPEALELLSRPLRYLGFDIESARLEHLLVNTIFYPGIVHYVGHCLVENLSTSYAKYYSVYENPPYSLTDKQLGEIMSSSDLNKRINDRIRWTLEVDDRYFMLARCVAYLYHEYPEQMKSGYAVENICEYSQLLDIDCLKDLDVSSILTLLQELVDMGILVRPGEAAFRLRQQRFLDIIGSREKIEADIQKEKEARHV